MSPRELSHVLRHASKKYRVTCASDASLHPDRTLETNDRRRAVNRQHQYEREGFKVRVSVRVG